MILAVNALWKNNQTNQTKSPIHQNILKSSTHIGDDDADDDRKTEFLLKNEVILDTVMHKVRFYKPEISEDSSNKCSEKTFHNLEKSREVDIF